MLLGQTGRLALQATTFMIVAARLGAAGYGLFAGVLAFVSTVAPFAGAGAGNVLVRDVAREPQRFCECWSRALMTICLFGCGALAVVVLLSGVLLPQQTPLLLIAAVGLADLLFARLVELYGFAFQAREMLRCTALVQLGASSFKCGAAALLLLTPSGSSLMWGVLYCGASAIAGSLGFLFVSLQLGWPTKWALPRLKDVKDGVLFSTSAGCQSLYNDADKVILANSTTLTTVGTYATAYRICDVTFAPISALLAAAYARFFKAGGQSVREAQRLAARLLAPALGYTLFAALALIVIGEGLETLLGATYAGLSEMLSVLSWLCVLRACHYFAADALTGAGYQGVRVIMQIIVAVAAVALGVLIIPEYSWRGAATLSLCCDGLLATLMWAGLTIVAARGRRARSHMEAREELR